MSNKNQEYKKTEIGKLPSEWEIKSIGDIGEIITGSTPKITYDFIDKVQHLWVSPADMGNTKYIRDTAKKLNNSSFNKTRILPKGSILVTCIGSTIGKIGIAGDELSTNQQINSIVCSEKYNNEYIYYVIDYNFNNYMRFISSQAVPIINKTTFSKIKIQIPRREEQEKIAEILSTWESAIEKQEQLIEKKIEFKKGLMQRLLSGKVRFKEFNDEWVSTKINHYIKPVIRECEKPTDAYWRLGLRSHGKGTFHELVEDPASVSMDKLYIVKNNDLIVNITFAWEHAIAVADKNDEGKLVSHRFPTYEFNENAYPKFFKYYILQSKFKHILVNISPGGAGRNRVMNKKDFLNISVKIPSYEEQAKIAEVLSAADKEIELLEKELEALKLQKKGLMQRLLTGEVRVKV